MLLIFLGSTDALSAEHTSRFLVPFLRWIDPTISAQAIAKIHLMLRKLGHITEYAVLTALLWRALNLTISIRQRGIVVAMTFLAAAAFAMTDEFHQSFVPARTASPADVLIDCGGAALALALCWRFGRKRARHA